MADIRYGAPSHIVSGKRLRPPTPSRYEWRVVDIHRDVTRHEAKQLLTEQAEYGRWELARSITFLGGARRVWLRRRVMSVKRTDAA